MIEKDIRPTCKIMSCDVCMSSICVRLYTAHAGAQMLFRANCLKGKYQKRLMKVITVGEIYDGEKSVNR